MGHSLFWREGSFPEPSLPVSPRCPHSPRRPEPRLPCSLSEAPELAGLTGPARRAGPAASRCSGFPSLDAALRNRFTEMRA